MPRCPFALVDLLWLLGAFRQKLREWQAPTSEVDEAIDWISRRIHELTGVRRAYVLQTIGRLANGQDLEGIVSPRGLAQTYHRDLTHVLRALRGLDRDRTTANLWRSLYQKWPIIRLVYDSIPPAQDKKPAATGPKRKRSTERGEGRDKLIAALTKHHQYAKGSCLNREPIGNNELARLAAVEESTASAFFKRGFGGHRNYRALCHRGASGLIAALKLLNDEFTPQILLGRLPADDGGRDDD